MKPTTGGQAEGRVRGGERGNLLRGARRRRRRRRRRRQGQPGKQAAAAAAAAAGSSARDQWEKREGENREAGGRASFLCAQGLAFQRWSTCLPLHASLSPPLLVLLLGRMRDANRKCVVNAATFIRACTGPASLTIHTTIHSKAESPSSLPLCVRPGRLRCSDVLVIEALCARSMILFWNFLK